MSLGPTSRIPSGLLQWLYLQTAGSFPNKYEDSIRFTWELARHYAESYPALLTQVVALNTPGLTGAWTQLIVPPGEAWYVLGVSAQTDQLTAGQTIQLALARYNNSLGPTPFVSEFLSDQSPLYGVGNNPVLCWKPQPMIMTAGDGLSVYGSTIAAGPINTRITVRFGRMGFSTT